MNLKINNVNFGRWASADWSRITSMLRAEAEARKIKLEDMPLYDNFQYIHKHTSGSEIAVNQYNKLYDKNGLIKYFPSTDIKDRALYRNINLAAQKLKEDKAVDEDEDLGFTANSRNSLQYYNKVYGRM